MYRNDHSASLARIAHLELELRRVKRLLAEATGTNLETVARFEPSKAMSPLLEQQPSPPELFSRAGEINAVVLADWRVDQPSVVISLKALMSQEPTINTLRRQIRGPERDDATETPDKYGYPSFHYK